jgi:O-antigen/teichoic acid export membrane protein
VLRRNIAIHGAASAVGAIALFALHAVAGRLLGVEEYGILSFGIAFSAMFLPAFDPGIGELTIRELARDRAAASRYISQAYIYRVLAAPPLFLIALGILYVLLDSNRSIIVGVAMFASMWVHLLRDTLQPVYVAFERFDLNAQILLFDRLGLLVAVAAVSATEWGLQGVVIAFLCWRVADLAYAAWLCNRKLVKLVYTPDLAFLKTMLVQALPIGTFYLTSSIYNYLDTIMIGVMRAHEEVGWYSAAYRLYEGFFLVSGVVGSVFMPRLSKAYAEKAPSLIALGVKGIGLLAASGLGCMIGIWMLSRPVVLLFYGGEFDVSATTLRVLSLGLPLAFIVHFLQTLLISTDRPKQMAILAVAGLVFNAALNYYLIPIYGHIGAAWATVASTLFVAFFLSLVAVVAAREYHRQTRRPETD